MKKRLTGRLTAQEMTAMALAATARVVPAFASAYPSGELAPRHSMDKARKHQNWEDRKPASSEHDEAFLATIP